MYMMTIIHRTGYEACKYKSKSLLFFIFQNELFLTQLTNISPNVDEILRRLSKTAVVSKFLSIKKSYLL